MSSLPIRSEILDTGNFAIKSARIVVNAPAAKIFEILASPKRHQEIDGSDTIQANFSGPDRLVLGSKFGMQMHLVIDYKILNTVVEFAENELIAWRHIGRWRWRYQLKSLSPRSTEITETFDASDIPWICTLWLKARKAYPWTQMAIAKSLVRLKEVAERS